jgi:hypothetical protein
MVSEEIVKHGHFNRDRVTVQFKRSFNVAKYENCEIVAGLSSDAKNGETAEEAFKRVAEVAQEEFENLCKLVEDGKLGR